MKKIIATILIMGGVITSFAQVPTKIFEKNMAFENHPKFHISRNNVPEEKMPTFDVTPLLEEDKAVEGLDVPFRFGKSFDVNLSLKDGIWIKTDSEKIWSLKISSPKAYSLNFIFSDLYLPKGAELYIFNEDGSMAYGPVTEKQNQHGKTYLTDIIQGDAVVIQLSVPINSIESPKLIIQNVIHGYKKIYPDHSLEDIGYGESGWCVKDEDIACYTAWSEESDGVVQILLANGRELCSGSLLNNTAQNYRPFILTAFHCIDIGIPNIQNDRDENEGVLEPYEIEESEGWLVRFGFKHTSCEGSTIGNVYTFDDTEFRAAWHPTDFALVELQDDILRDEPSVGQKVWLGWDQTGNIPSTVTCIHHPAGDVMKYTYDGESPSITNFGGTNNSHWFVDDWDIGNTEGGSSGSPLFDQNKRVIGQDHAGDGKPICDEDKGTYFGSLSLSWDGGGDSTTQLSCWLNPLGGTVTTLNSARPAPEYSGIPDQLCSSTSFSVTDLPPGYSFQQWNGNNVTFSNNTSNPVQVTPVSNGEAWVEAVVHTGWGTATMPRMHFWAGAPDPNDFEVYIEVLGGNGVPGSPGGPFELCVGEQYYVSLYPYHLFDDQGITDVEFDFTFDYNELDSGDDYIEIEVNSSPENEEGEVYVTTTCGYYTLKFMEFVEGNCGYYLMFSPNPTTGETALSIEQGQQQETVLKSAAAGESFDMNAEWDMEIYSPTQALKAQKTKLKGKSTIIQTAGWTEGVYTVRVNYKGDIITGKLIVKK